MRPWIYGSRVGTWFGPLGVLQHARITYGSKVSLDYIKRSRGRNHVVCTPGTYVRYHIFHRGRKNMNRVKEEHEYIIK